MSQLDIQINGRSYNIACDDGQEAHLRKLAAFFGKRVDELAGNLGQIGDARLMLMAGLMVADELSDAYADVESLKSEMAQLKAASVSKDGADSASAAAMQEMEDKLSSILSSMTTRIEALAGKLEG